MYTEPISEHGLDMSAYSCSGKIRALIGPWLAYLMLLGATRPAWVQEGLRHISGRAQVEWVQSGVRFLIGGLPWVWPALLFFSVAAVARRQPFDRLRIYADGVGFLLHGEERRVPYAQVHFSYGRLRESVYIESKALGIRPHNYGWKAFGDGEILQRNLERYSDLSGKGDAR